MTPEAGEKQDDNISAFEDLYESEEVGWEKTSQQNS
jgi:hypothetical protein